MKVKYTLFFKSGIIKEFTQTATKEEIARVNEIICESFENDMEGVLTLGDGEKKGILVRLDDLSMVEIEEIE